MFKVSTFQFLLTWLFESLLFESCLKVLKTTSNLRISPCPQCYAAIALQAGELHELGGQIKKQVPRGKN